MPKLTKRLVESLVRQDREYFVWDSAVIGFGVRVMPSGTRTYQIQYRHGARTRRNALGRHGVLTVDQARSKARELLGLAAMGSDPIEEIAMARLAPTVADLCNRFLEVHVAERCKSATARDYRSSIRRMIKPEIGSFRVSDVHRKDVANLHYRFRSTPIQANRMLAVLSKMFNLAEMWGLRDDGTNPCRHVPKYRENRRERFLSQTEIQHLGDILRQSEADGSESPHVIAAFRLLLLTGCRLSEVQTLRWEWITDRGMELPDTKTGRRCIPLPGASREVLASKPRTVGNPFVIEGKIADTHITDLQHPWQRLRAKPGWTTSEFTICATPMPLSRCLEGCRYRWLAACWDIRRCRRRCDMRTLPMIRFGMPQRRTPS